MTPTITLSLDLGWGGSPIRVTRPISDELIRRTYQRLDFPSEDAGIAALLCTDPGTLRTVVKIRKDAAALIAKTVSRALLDTMESHDTLMGYPIERDDKPR